MRVVPIEFQSCRAAVDLHAQLVDEHTMTQALRLSDIRIGTGYRNRQPRRRVARAPRAEKDELNASAATVPLGASSRRFKGVSATASRDIAW